MKKEIEILLDQLAKSVEKDPLFRFIESKREYLDDPEKIDCMINHKIREMINLAVIKHIPNANHVVKDIYNNYSFFYNHLSEICGRLYGPAASGDKARFIIKEYIKFKSYGTVYEWNYKQVDEPKTGAPPLWFYFVEALSAFLAGNSTPYLKTYEILIKDYNLYLKKVKGESRL